MMSCTAALMTASVKYELMEELVLEAVSSAPVASTSGEATAWSYSDWVILPCSSIRPRI